MQQTLEEKFEKLRESGISEELIKISKDIIYEFSYNIGVDICEIPRPMFSLGEDREVAIIITLNNRPTTITFRLREINNSNLTYQVIKGTGSGKDYIEELIVAEAPIDSLQLLLNRNKIFSPWEAFIPNPKQQFK